jgi:FGGY-family pentulose kinase
MGIDVGTQAGRVGIFNSRGDLLAMASASYETNYPKPGWAEQNPFDWWHAICKCSREVVEKVKGRGNVGAIAVCATSSTVLAVDSAGLPLGNAIIWMDSRAGKECRTINATRHDILKYSGGEVSVEWMVPKRLWLKRNRSDMYSRAAMIVEALDWINYKLTGVWAISKCNAGCKWNYVDTENGWNVDFFRQIGLEDFAEKWPSKVLAMGEAIGHLTKDACRDLGLSESPLLVQGSIDAHTGMLGLGVTETGELAVIMGTSFVHLALSDKPVFAKGLWGPYPNVIVPDLWLLEGGQISAGSITRWFRDHLAKDIVDGGDRAYQRLAEEAKNVPPGSEGLIVLDFWQGNRTPFRDPQLSGAIWGLRLNHERGHVYRAILEAVGYGNKNVLQAFRKNDFQPKKIIACGGAVKNDLWIQIIADICQMPITITRETEAVLLGAAVNASVGSGFYGSFTDACRQMVSDVRIVQPNEENREVYSYYFKKYLETHEVLRPMMSRMENERTPG